MQATIRLLLPVLLAAAALPCAAQLVDTNIALNKPTTGDTALGFPTSLGNDGNTATFTHADNVNLPPDNPYWAVDLQGEFDLVRIEIVDRIGCCDPNRLNGAEIRVYDGQGGQIGDVLLVDGLPENNPVETATVAFDNGGAGWPGAASIRVDGFQQYFQFSELRAISLQPAPPPEPANAAPNGVASASGAVWGDTFPSNLIDGNAASFVHPLAQFGTLGFFYTIDLLKPYTFERLEILNRHNCCPDRLSNYRVSLHNDNGANQPGPAIWTTDVRADGSNSGQGGVDTLTADLDPTGTFTARFIIIENLNDYEYSPQIAEVRALTFDELPPPNVTQGKPVGCYDAAGTPVGTWGGFPAGFINDGNLGTFSHPLEQFSAGYYYEIDLGEEMLIGSVELTGRLPDLCCPERLTNATLEILDGTSNTVFLQEIASAVVEPTLVDTGVVSGRYLRVINTSGADYGPQIGEVRAFPPSGPAVPFQITALEADTQTGNGTVTFTSRPGAFYSLFSTDDFIDWVELSDSVESDGEVTVEAFFDIDLVGADARYYQIRRNQL